uniref:Uncharacterized protein n=1 Tax=Picea glauca TaxID=3330 RepID=A0A101LZA7_PICGL|nr:hypothetical protein ABT39_MTgene5096 [Picea glauca]
MGGPWHFLKKRFADSLNELSLLFHKQMELTW